MRGKFAPSSSSWTNGPFGSGLAGMLAVSATWKSLSQDLIEKFSACQRLPSLEEYVVVTPNPAQPEVRVFRRAEGWEPGEMHRDGSFTLRSIGLTLPVTDLHAG
jgi:Uma2 family endonuclease